MTVFPSSTALGNSHLRAHPYSPGPIPLTCPPGLSFEKETMNGDHYSGSPPFLPPLPTHSQKESLSQFDPIPTTTTATRANSVMNPTTSSIQFSSTDSNHIPRDIPLSSSGHIEGKGLVSTYCKFPSIPFLSDPSLHPLDEPPTSDYSFTATMPSSLPSASPSDESDVNHNQKHSHNQTDHKNDRGDKNNGDDCHCCKEMGDQCGGGRSVGDGNDECTKSSISTPENTILDFNQTVVTNELDMNIQAQRTPYESDGNDNENGLNHLACVQTESAMGFHSLYGEWNHRFSDPIWRSQQQNHRGLFGVGVLGQEMERPRK